MAVTLVAAWLVGGRSARRRKWGFWVFVLSNLLWCFWGAFSHSYALIVLQLGLFAMNLRGARKNEKSRPNDDTAAEDHATDCDHDSDHDTDTETDITATIATATITSDDHDDAPRLRR